jgi:hypothetical protein
MAEFSSPEACGYEHRSGFVPHDTKQDLLVAEMTWKDAKVINDDARRTMSVNDACWGFADGDADGVKGVVNGVKGVVDGLKGVVDGVK